MPIAVRGLRELNAALAHADRDVRLGVRAELRNLGEPVRQDAERFAAATITRIGPRWSRMRVGVTRTLVYVAPKERGKGRNPRPRFGTLLMQRAMEPALAKDTPMIEARLEALIDGVAVKFNR